ncbi:MAG: peptidoglycan DD-metalloendopeptidase family protein [Treponema sp.]
MKKVSFSCLFLLCMLNIPCQQSIFPLITELSAHDPVFCQYSDDVQQARKALAEGKQGKELPLHFYRYQAKKDDTVIRIAARCGVLYDALITLNAIETVKTEITGTILILPTLPALYVVQQSSSDIGRLTEALCQKMNIAPITITLPLGGKHQKKIQYQCFPNAILDGTIRNFFFTPYYRFPLPHAVITSTFGMRKSPFTGKASYHAGIDLAAPEDTPVYACADGTVIETAYSPVYGNYIMLRHTDKRVSLYGHLNSVCIRLHETVKPGKIIGRVGSTGLSTGPHLHFEIREQGKAKDPALFIRAEDATR